MSKAIRCPWCQEETLVTEEVSEKQFGNVKTRRCDKYGKVVASYLIEERDFLPKIRVFENE